MKRIQVKISFDALIAFFSNYSQELGSCFFTFEDPDSLNLKTVLGFFPEEHILKSWQSNNCSWQALKELVITDGALDQNAPLYQLFLPFEYPRHQRASNPYFQKSRCCMEYDHASQQLIIYFSIKSPWASYFKGEDKTLRWINSHQSNLNYTMDGSKKIFSSDSQSSYMEKVRKIQEQIREGNVYQVCLSRQVCIEAKVDNPFAVYIEYYKEYQPCMAGYYSLPGHMVLSFSPERLISCKNNELIAMPIKGTAPRFTCSWEDQKSYERLKFCQKEKAELMMITDLIRNDIGKVAEIGTVKVDRLREIFPYASVWQARSLVKAKKKAGIDAVDILKALFPGGSISGCPKESALDILEDLEEQRRSFFTGSIGYITGRGDLDFNISIRTMSITDDQIQLNAGGAVTIDSNPLEEYLETGYKLSPLLQLIGVKGEDEGTTMAFSR